MLAFFVAHLVNSLPDCRGLLAAVADVPSAVAAHACLLDGLVADAEVAAASCTAGPEGREVVSGCTGLGRHEPLITHPK